MRSGAVAQLSYGYTTVLADNRTWVDRQYWLPISIIELNKAPQLEQNPGYK